MAQDNGSSFILELYSSTLELPPAKIGFGLPLARDLHFLVISLDGLEVARTPMSCTVNGEIEWEIAYTHHHWQGSCAGVQSSSGPPKNISVSLWTKTRLSPNLFRGSLTIPVAGVTEDVGELEDVEFALTKAGQRTGTVALSLTKVSPFAKADVQKKPSEESAAPQPAQEKKKKMLLRSGSGLSHVSQESKQSRLSARSRASKSEAGSIAGETNYASTMSKTSVLSIGLELDHLMAIIENRRIKNKGWPAAIISLAEPGKFEEDNKDLLSKIESEAAPEDEAKIDMEVGAGPSESYFMRGRAGTVNIAQSMGDMSLEPSHDCGEADIAQDHDALIGTWKCVSTQGLEAFLAQAGVSAFQKNIAMAARWPYWEYSNSAESGTVHFFNHSSVGSFKEIVLLNGKEYEHTDGHNNALVSSSTWVSTKEGGVLSTTRSGPLGSYSEERRVVGDRLEFILQHPESGHTWGRSFNRSYDSHMNAFVREMARQSSKDSE